MNDTDRLRPRAIPKIVCLCGSTKFYDAFQAANYAETMKGHVVLSVGFYPHSAYKAHGQEIGCTPQQKEMLDRLHKRKIDLADEVLVLNVDGYVGDSTASEIQYAKRTGKVVRWLDESKIPNMPDVPVTGEAIGRTWQVELQVEAWVTVVAGDPETAKRVAEAGHPGMRVRSVRDFWTREVVVSYDDEGEPVEPVNG